MKMGWVNPHKAVRTVPGNMGVQMPTAVVCHIFYFHFWLLGNSFHGKKCEQTCWGGHTERKRPWRVRRHIGKNQGAPVDSQHPDMWVRPSWFLRCCGWQQIKQRWVSQPSPAQIPACLKSWTIKWSFFYAIGFGVVCNMYIFIYNIYV